MLLLMSKYQNLLKLISYFKNTMPDTDFLLWVSDRPEPLKTGQGLYIDFKGL